MTPAAITFDFWATLCQDAPENVAPGQAMRVRGVAAALARAGHAFSPDVVDDACHRGLAGMQAQYWSRNIDVPADVQVGVVLDCLEPGLAAALPAPVLADAVRGYVAPLDRFPPVLLPGAGDAVRALAARGVPLAIISNTGRTPGVVLRRALERYGLLACFQVTTYSDEAGVRKPAREIFERTLAALGVPPAKALHIGDDATSDIQGARALGMRTAHYVASHDTRAARPASPDADLIVEDLSKLATRLFC